MSDTGENRERTLKELVKYYEDPDFVRFKRETDDPEDGDEVFYVIDADLLDSVIAVLGGKVKPDEAVVDFDEFTGDEDGDDEEPEAG